ncbi:CLUMA_CG000199, isoform A [Clunio marinus]|uniref:CLUMA_CG000199, isoform A n=1 Tax=Clunio marinus TaxID=568069 RepID=A0A1J1HEQ2_9DIPT|nr:CLUMA_CG000199, isoform A [Clunio marinus]
MQEKMKFRSEESIKSENVNRTRNQPQGIIEWIDYYQKNKPQTNALAAGIMIMIYSGQQLGWGIFNNHLKAQPWAGGYEDEGSVFWVIITWFIASIVGFFFASIIVNNLSKLSIYILASVLSGISAALLITFSADIYYVFISRILGGLAHGITYPTVLIHASEVSVVKLRGMVVSTIHLCFIIGVFTTSSSLLPVYDARSYEVDPTKTIGINGLICVATGVLIAIFFNRESPVFLIRKYRDKEAIQTMIRLRCESSETIDIRKDFSELKIMVMEDIKSNLNIFDRANRWPLFVVLVMKIIFVASFNMPLNLIWLEAVESKLYNGKVDPSGMCLSGIRWIVILIMMFLIDFKRIKFYIYSTLLSCGLLCLLLIALRSSAMGDDETTLITLLAFMFQATTGIAIGILADVYSTEAFNTRKKPLSIAFSSSFEFLLQIFMIAVVFYLKDQTTTIICGLTIVMGLGIFAYFIPDTSGMSLLKARNKFLCH